MYSYPVTLERDDNGSILVGFPDLPWVHSFGDDEADALAHASDALESAFVAIIGGREVVPAPSKIARGQKRVTLPALSTAKVAVYAAMREAGLRKADLARRLAGTCRKSIGCSICGMRRASTRSRRRSPPSASGW
jgi:antitoxin HicB